MVNLEEGELVEVNNFRLDYNKRVWYRVKKNQKTHLVKLIHLNKRILWNKNRKLHKIKGAVYEVHEWVVVNKKTKKKGWSIFMLPVLENKKEYSSILEEYADYSKEEIRDPFDYVSCDPDLRVRSYNLKGFSISSKNLKSKSLLAYEARENLKLDILKEMLNGLQNHTNKENYKILEIYLITRIKYLSEPSYKTLKKWEKFLKTSSHQIVICNVRNYLSMRL